MGVSSLPKTVTQQRRDSDLNLGPSGLTTRLPSHPDYNTQEKQQIKNNVATIYPVSHLPYMTQLRKADYSLNKRPFSDLLKHV